MHGSLGRSWFFCTTPTISSAALAGARGQLTHLVGYYGSEAAALIAGASSFDGGVERQQVGLIGDPADGLENGTDQLRLLVQRLDAIGSLLHLLGNAMHHIDGLLDHLGAALGTEIGVCEVS